MPGILPVMSTAPEILFADAAGSAIAYEVYGLTGDDAPVICAVPPFAQNIELAWESPRMRSMFARYAAFSRQVVFDKRGTGMSDRGLDIPGLDERVDELRAVMDAAGIERAFIHGVSEGGPMAIVYAATYPERVQGLILEGTGASLVPDAVREALEDPEARAAADVRRNAFISAWGTPDTMSIGLFGPSLLEDEEFCRWWPRYERNAASRGALEQLFAMNRDMDARGVIDRVECPVLILHRTGDLVTPVEGARETRDLFAAAGADVRLVEVPGADHWTFAGDMDPLVDAIEQFTTGEVSGRTDPRIAPRDAAAAPPRHRAEIATLGRFEVTVDGEPVPPAAWGSRRARTLLKRLVVARGWPVTRDELTELLWPGEVSDRLSARLSVQLSAVRRVLHGGVVADRSTVRLDLSAVAVDLERWFALDDDGAVVDAYADLLPEDVDAEWAAAMRQQARDRFVAAAGRLVAQAGVGDDRALVLLRRLIDIDPFDEASHRELVRRLRLAGRQGEAAAAHEAYETAMDELLS